MVKDWATLPLRIALGVAFLAHGLQKVFGMFSGPGIAGFSGMLSGIGFQPATFWAYLVAYIELIGGLFLLIGLLTRITSVLLLIVMAVAVLKVHLANGFFLSKGGFEYSFFIACACISLLLSGPGKLSVNKRL